VLTFNVILTAVSLSGVEDKAGTGERGKSNNKRGVRVLTFNVILTAVSLSGVEDKAGTGKGKSNNYDRVKSPLIKHFGKHERKIDVRCDLF
jgi:hypothetical protein